MNLVLFGPPGAGKGTQSTLMVDRLSMKQISTGDLFRAAMKQKTPLGLQVQEYIDQGKLVPDALTIQMVEEVVDQNKGKSFIFDGFPRNVAQAEVLKTMLAQKDSQIDKAVFLEVPEGDLLKRLTGRRVCRSCGTVFHMELKPPKVAGKCDVCGGEIYQRADDKEEVIGTRLKTYFENTLPLKKYYQAEGSLLELNGLGDPEKVFQDIKRALNL